MLIQRSAPASPSGADKPGWYAFPMDGARRGADARTDPAAPDGTPNRPYAELHEVMLSWYEIERRDLPWRRTRDPYRILVSEIMLQQTQVERVIPKYEEFLARFPTVLDLAEAPLSEVLRVWSPLGYNRRARYLHLAARAARERFDGDL